MGRRFGARPGRPDEAGPPDAPDRPFGGRAPRAHVRGDPACVRAGGPRCCARLLADPCNRGVVGHSAGGGEGAKPVKAAFATLGSPVSDIEVSRTDRGGESGRAEIDLAPAVLGAWRSSSAKGRPCGSAVDESTNRILKAEPACRDSFPGLRDPQAKPPGCVRWRNNLTVRSTPGRMGPVEFGKAGLILSKPSK